MLDTIERGYRDRAERWQHDADALDRQRTRIANFRLAAGGALIAAALYWVVARDLRAVPAAIVAAVLFALLVRRFRILTELWQRAATLARINREGLARVQRDWSALPDPRAISISPDHPYANDLDLVGKASLQQLLDTTGTTLGASRLDDWIVRPAPVDDIPVRQAAVRELAEDFGWLQELQQLARRGEVDQEKTARFLEWATDSDGPGRQPLLTWLARLGVVALIAVIGLSIAGILDSGWLGGILVYNLVIATLLHRKVGRSLDAALQHGHAIRAYANLIELLSARTHRSDLLRQLDAPLHVDGVSAADAANRLARILSYGIPRGTLQSYVLQAAVAWDVHFYDRLEAWRSTYGAEVPRWLETIGWYEALGSLANLAHDNPTWAFPTVADAHDRFEATALGHPLIPARRRVSNDVTVGPPGTFLFVTGSNMSGKSTLLRSIGMNIVLANMGAPVCADRLSLPPVSLWTSVRIVDSLEQGVSYYMAELLRLKQIVDAALRHRAGDPIVCFLLDEILSGTNTAERQIAARRVISLLVDHGAIGAASSHDLDLVAGDQLASKAQEVHFVETMRECDGRLDMTFDYTLRPGLATSTNALALMEMVGIPLQDAPGSTL